ncbi:hypothetical protein ES705_10960 [subsurface metagenome]
MKLYIAWELKGKLITSPRPAINLDMDSDDQQVYETVGASPFLTWWLEDPERAKFYYDILEQLMPILGEREAKLQTLYMCFKMMSHFLGKQGIVWTGKAITLTAAVKTAILELTTVIAASKALTMLAVGAAMLMLFMGIMWIINPKMKGTRTITWGRGRWLMRYQEKLWWADLVGCSMKGKDMFTRCEPIPGVVVKNTYGPRGGVPVWVVPGDLMQFYGTWIESGWDFPNYETISWTQLKASYVGLLKNVGAPYYTLIEGYDPTWVGESEPGWTKPTEKWCVEPQHEVKNVMIEA